VTIIITNLIYNPQITLFSYMINKVSSYNILNGILC